MPDPVFMISGELPETVLDTVFATRRIYDEQGREAIARMRRPTNPDCPGQLALFDL